MAQKAPGREAGVRKQESALRSERDREEMAAWGFLFSDYSTVTDFARFLG